MIIPLASGPRPAVASGVSTEVSAFRADRGRTLGVKLAGIMAAAGATDLDIDELGLDRPVGYAVLHHALYQAAVAARERDVGRIAEITSLLTCLPNIGTAEYPLCVAAAQDCHLTEDSRFGSPVYALTAKAVQGASAPEQLLADMVRLLDTSGQLSWVREGGSAFVLRDRLAPGAEQGAFSYSVGILPYTIFTDWPDDPVVLGECLLHESVHSWLNVALAWADEKLPAEPVGYSPWKGVDRPAFGLIHAGLAFGVVSAFLEKIHDQPGLEPDQRRYCEVRSNVERIRLGQARSAVEKALSFVQNQEIAGLVARYAFASAG
jgi:hypothetical protein